MTEISMTIPVVINTNYGGYSLSNEASLELARRKGIQTREDGLVFVGTGYETVAVVVPRNDHDLIAVVREMGERAGSDLKVVDVTVNIELESYDGKERVRVSGGNY